MDLKASMSLSRAGKIATGAVFGVRSLFMPVRFQDGLDIVVPIELSGSLGEWH